MLDIDIDLKGIDCGSPQALGDQNIDRTTATKPNSMQDVLRDAIYQIRTEIFPEQAKIVLSNFYPVMEQLYFALEIKEGSIKSIIQDEKELLSLFARLAPTSKILIERLLGEPIDGGAKMAFSSALRSIVFIENQLQNENFLNKFEINEVRMGGDFLMLGLNMLRDKTYQG